MGNIDRSGYNNRPKTYPHHMIDDTMVSQILCMYMVDKLIIASSVTTIGLRVTIIIRST